VLDAALLTDLRRERMGRGLVGRRIGPGYGKAPYSRRVGRCGFGMLAGRSGGWMHCVTGRSPIECQSVNIASTEEWITIGWRRRARIAGTEVRTALFVLNDISSGGNAASAASVVARVGNMRH